MDAVRMVADCAGHQPEFESSWCECGEEKMGRYERCVMCQMRVEGELIEPGADQDPL